MASGKALVLGSVLKVDRPFKAATITLMTGLSRQLVFGHLTNLVETGYLEKIDKHYIIRDREGLLSTLIEAAESVESGMPKPAGFFDANSTNVATVTCNMIISGRTLDLPMSHEAKLGYLQRIDDSVKYLKQLRKYLMTSQKTVGSAQKYLKKEGFNSPEGIEAVWKKYSALAGEHATVDVHEFAEAFRIALLEESDGTG